MYLFTDCLCEGTVVQMGEGREILIPFCEPFRKGGRAVTTPTIGLEDILFFCFY